MSRADAPRTYEVRTFGCQMNKHDSERIAGLLRAAGMAPAADTDHADVVVFNTCCVRENADERLRGQVASLKRLKPHGSDGPVIAVGGCIGQRDGAALLRDLPHVDVVFGTHNLAHLPTLVDTAWRTRSAAVEVLDAADGFASDLPSAREHRWHAWVPVTVGCDNHCSYCIVPRVRGRERSRAFEAVVDECSRLAADGVVEVTLLGQNVNSYGRDLYGAPRFAELLRAVAGTGIEWLRFTTSHPKDLSAETIAAMAETPQVCRYLHLPVQSGSDAVLAAMNRHYTKESYLALVDDLRAAMPDLALSTDAIVGFPGETEEDFAHTLDVFSTVRFDQAFTFIYSPREGTRAASMTPQVPREVAQERFDRLVAVVQASALERNLPYAGTERLVLVDGASRRDPGMLSARTASNKVVHAPVPASTDAGTLAGTFVTVRIEEAQTWFLTGHVVGR